MKKMKKIFLLVLMSIGMLASTVYAVEEEYIVTKEMIYENTKKYSVNSAFVEVLVGNTNFVQYQEDNEIIITPLPDELREDEFGNIYAYFDVSGLRPKQKFKITIKRDSTVSSYEELIPSRTNSIINEETEKYVQPAERIESDNPEIISKAKEITEGESTDYKKAQAIFEFVNVNMSYDESSTYANKGAVAALESMRGVCEEFATLYVAMCRAVDIPSRMIEGYKIADVQSGDAVIGKELINHVWAEIYLEDFGWVPVEPTVIYVVNGERKPYLDSFCVRKEADYISIAIYNYDEANRKIKGVSEVQYTETFVLKNEMEPERQNEFSDISGYTWATDSIQELYAKNIVNGYSNEVFGPERNISRIEFISMLARLLRYYDTQKDDNGLVYYYPDFDENHWAKDDYDYLMQCYQAIEPSDISALGFDTIVSVFGVGALEANKPITRGEAVALLAPFLDDTYELADFTDIATSTHRYEILKAYANGIINGYPDYTFRPDNSITRAEAAVIFGRYIEKNIFVL